MLRGGRDEAGEGGEEGFETRSGQSLELTGEESCCATRREG